MTFKSDGAFSALLDYTFDTVDPLEVQRKLQSAKAANQASANAAIFQAIATLDGFSSIAAAQKKVLANSSDAKAVGDLVTALGGYGTSLAPKIEVGKSYQATFDSVKDFLVSLALDGVRSGGVFASASAALSNSLADYSRKLAADPPDPNFHTFDAFVPIALNAEERAKVGDDLVLNALIDQANFFLAARSALHAAERYQGALEAQDIEAASTQYDILQAALAAADQQAVRATKSGQLVLDNARNRYYADLIMDETELSEARTRLNDLDLSSLAYLFEPGVQVASLQASLDAVRADSASFGAIAGTPTIFAGLSNGLQDQADAWLGIRAVPEAETWAMMIIGFGVVGVVMRRQRRAGQSLLKVKCRSNFAGGAILHS